jgi:hypothetical protein
MDDYLFPEFLFYFKQRFGDWAMFLSLGKKPTHPDPMIIVSPYLWTPEATHIKSFP